MKFSTSGASLVVAAACVAAAPLRTRSFGLGGIVDVGAMPDFSASCTVSKNLIGAGPGLMLGGPGAIFFQSNDPESNTVYSINVDVSGTMTFGGAYATGGFGMHIGPDIQAPDSLAIQGSVKVTNDKMVVANAGSNTFSLFQIDFENPALVRMIGEPVSSYGSFPSTSTISAVNGNVCGMNSGDDGAIVCYTVDLRRGLIPIPNSMRSLGLNLTTPPSSQDNTPSHIVFSPDSTQLLASVKGGAAGPGFVALWDVAADGSLSEQFTKIPLPQGVESAGTLTFVHNANAVINQAIGVGFTVINLNDTTSAGTLTPVPGTVRNQWSEDSTVTGNYYFSDLGAKTLTEISVDSDTLAATVVMQYPLVSEGMDQEITTLDGHDTMFVLQPNSVTIQSFSLVGPGQAEELQVLDIAAAAAAVGVPIRGQNIQGLNGFFQG
jgi:hypothetical protein